MICLREDAMLLPMIRLPVIKESSHGLYVLLLCETSMVMDSDLENFINFFTFQLISAIAHNHSIAPSYPSHPFLFFFFSPFILFLHWYVPSISFLFNFTFQVNN